MVASAVVTVGRESTTPPRSVLRIADRFNLEEHDMTLRSSIALWEGNLKTGTGTMRIGPGTYDVPYSFTSRFEAGPGTNPEELIAAAHAGCFSMALAHALSEAGHPPVRVETTARVHLEKTKDGFAIPRIDLTTDVDAPGLDEAEFRRQAEDAKKNCPVSKVLAGAEITLQAALRH
jgi:osmotically inducible protein OsmC